jgi:hypothetical protein
MKGVNMLRRRLSVIASVVLLATVAHAGEVKVHQWPAQFVPLEVTSYPVVMDIGYWMEIVNQLDVIKLQQVTINKYQGCCSITPTGAVSGTYTATLKDAAINPPYGVSKLCVTLTNPNLTGQPGGSRNVHVATVVVRVMPR